MKLPQPKFNFSKAPGPGIKWAKSRGKQKWRKDMAFAKYVKK
jgi:hypothetical protein